MQKMRRRGLIGVVVVSVLSNAYLVYLFHQSTSAGHHSSSVNIFAPPSLEVAPRERHNNMIPDWNIVVDCSAWDIMCATSSILESRYEPYPFPLSRSINNNDFDHQPMSDVPNEWRKALNVDNSLDMPPTRPVSYNYPPEVPAPERDKCIKQSNDLSWQMQIDILLESGRVKKERTTDMVAFTISDFNYAFDMIHDVFQMTSDIVGFEGSFFIVALDKQTVDNACTFGYPVLAWPSGKADDMSQLKHAVASTKFEVSLFLVTKGIGFLFYEMDVWFLKSPKPYIAAYHNEEEDGTHDMLASSHMDNPLSVNIGVYSVTANERTKEFFKLCTIMAKESPNTHDQYIFGQLLLLAWTINETGSPGVKFNRMWNPIPKPEYNPPKMDNPLFWGLYTTMEIMAGERPYPTKNTIAIHTLTKNPLRRPFGKKILAKELGAWTGFTGTNGDGGYYARTGVNRRYLMMDGHDSPSSYNTVQTFEWDAMNAESFLVNSASAFQWTMAVLLSLARRTGRIFIMPKLISKEGGHFLWTVLDFEAVEEMKIDFRETNFPHNKKSSFSSLHSVARTALAPINDVDKEGSMYVQFPNKEITAWKLDMSEEQALDAWWGLHTAVSEVDSAELLLVNPHFISASTAAKLKSKMRRNDYTPSIAEKEIIEVYKRLRWCLGNPIVNKETTIGQSAAELSCHLNTK